MIGGVIKNVYVSYPFVLYQAIYKQYHTVQTYTVHSIITKIQNKDTILILFIALAHYNAIHLYYNSDYGSTKSLQSRSQNIAHE